MLNIGQQSYLSLDVSPIVRSWTSSDFEALVIDAQLLTRPDFCQRQQVAKIGGSISNSCYCSNTEMQD